GSTLVGSGSDRCARSRAGRWLKAGSLAGRGRNPPLGTPWLGSAFAGDACRARTQTRLAGEAPGPATLLRHCTGIWSLLNREQDTNLLADGRSACQTPGHPTCCASFRPIFGDNGGKPPLRPDPG